VTKRRRSLPSATTHQPSTEHKHVWAVERFHVIRQIASTVRGKEMVRHYFSPVKKVEFPGQESATKQWYLELWPFGKGEENKGAVSLFLGTENTTPLVCHYKFSLLDQNRQEVHNREPEGMRSFTQDRDWGFDEFITQAELEELSPVLDANSDRLTILCEMEIFWQTTETFPNAPPSSASNLVTKLGAIGHDNKYSDVIIECGGIEFKANKLILMAQSKVFERMLDGEYSEARESRVQVRDVDKYSMRQLLQYFYSDKCDLLDPQLGGDQVPALMKLYYAAQKYQIDKLVVEIDDLLSELFKPECIFAILIQADTYHNHALKQQCLDYIVEHSYEVAVHPTFNEVLYVQGAHLVQEVVQAISAARARVPKRFHDIHMMARPLSPPRQSAPPVLPNASNLQRTSGTEQVSGAAAAAAAGGGGGAGGDMDAMMGDFDAGEAFQTPMGSVQVRGGQGQPAAAAAAAAAAGASRQGNDNGRG